MTTIVPSFTQSSLVTILTLNQPLSHHDPDQAGSANVTPIRRQARLIPVDVPDVEVTQDALDRVLRALPVPGNLLPFISQLTAAEFLACGVVALWIDRYRSADGDGLFTGMERYKRLASRLEQCARRTESIYHFWSDLARAMQVGGEGHSTPEFLTVLSMPRVLGMVVLRTMAEQVEYILMIAREWAEQKRLQSEQYAEATGNAVGDKESVAMNYDATAIPKPTNTVVRQVAHLSGNSLRHNLVREPGLHHLLNALGIGHHALPPSVGFLFNHGGTIRKGGKAPSNEASVGHAITDAYPLLALLGGCTDAFFLPDGMLSLETHLVCTENARALARFGIEPEHSASALVDHETLHRLPHARYDESPMPYSFETLIPGAQFAVRLTISPYAAPMARGALLTALSTAQALDMLVVGGQSRAGYSSVSMAINEHDEQWTVDAGVYERHLAVETNRLIDGLMDGTLCSGSKVVAV